MNGQNTFQMLRTCSKSPEQKPQEGEVDELQAGVEFTLAVFPQSPVFLQPGKGSFDDPAFGYDLEGVPFTPFGDLHRHLCAKGGLYVLGKGFSHVATIRQQALHLSQSRFAAH